MKPARAALIAVALLVTSCREREVVAEPIDASNPLEQAARDANLVEDPDTSEPTGLFERRHSSGRDALCVVPDADGGYRFGLIASFGATLMCQGQGVAAHQGARVHLKFDDVECELDALYDGRSVRLPGRVPAGCAAICGPRASISGVAISRVGWSEADARTLKSRREADGGLPLCR